MQKRAMNKIEQKRRVARFFRLFCEAGKDLEKQRVGNPLVGASNNTSEKRRQDPRQLRVTLSNFLKDAR
jgi:hypothetical protein